MLASMEFVHLWYFRRYMYRLQRQHNARMKAIAYYKRIEDVQVGRLLNEDLSGKRYDHI